jgi:signal peptidase II
MMPSSAWRSPGAWFTLLVCALAGLVIDLWSKHVAFERVAGAPVQVLREDVLAAGPKQLYQLIPPHPPIEVVPSWLNFTLVLNPGAVFGLGAGQRWIFVMFTLAAVAFCLMLFRSWTTATMRLAHAAIGLVLAGGVGNLYDRLKFACVRDFIHPLPDRKLPFGITWPGGSKDVWPYVSNVADLLLIIGIGVLAIYALRAESGEKRAEKPLQRSA